MLGVVFALFFCWWCLPQGQKNHPNKNPSKLHWGSNSLSNTLGNMLQRLLHLINQDQAKVARLQPPERRIDRKKFSADLFNVAGALRTLQALAQ